MRLIKANNLKSVILSLALLILGSIFLYGCGKDNTTSEVVSSSSSVTSVSQLPGATSSVSGVYSDFLDSRGLLNTNNRAMYSEISKKNNYSNNQGRDGLENNGNLISGKLATAGKVLASLTTTPFVAATTKSRAACEVGSILKGSIYKNAVTPDKIKCYIGAIYDNPTESGLNAGDINTAGDYNYFNISEGGTSQGTVKFKIVKTAGVITQFEMFECMDGRQSDQSSYFNATITGTDISMSLKQIMSGTQSGNTWNHKNQFTVAGTLLGTNLTSKQLTNIYTSSFSQSNSTSTSYGKAIVDEYASTFKLNAFMHNTGTGQWGGNYFANAQDVTIFSVVQLLNATTGKMETLAMGDGSAKAILSSKNKTGTSAVTVSDAEACTTNGVGNCWVQDETESYGWTGDDVAGMTFDSSAYGYTEVNASSPALTQSSPTIAFDSTEAWDCSTVASGGTMLSVTLPSSGVLTEAMAACDTQYGFGDDGGMLECWQLDRNN
jgi:hypothetical protein